MKDSKPPKEGKIVQQTRLGKYYWGNSTDLLTSNLGTQLKGKVQMILTSPPFPLNHKKSYGNLNGNPYEKWFSGLAPKFADLLTPTGSIVIEMGNAWMPDRPVQSLLHLESLIAFVKNPDARLRLCQQFICYNPSRLPSLRSGSPSSEFAQLTVLLIFGGWQKPIIRRRTTEECCGLTAPV